MEGEKRFENLKRIGLVKGTCFFSLYVKKVYLTMGRI